MGVSGNLCSFLKEVKPLVLYAVEHGIAMEPMKGKWASSRVDLWYTELFCIPEVTSVFISFFDSVLGDFLVFHQENRGSLCIWLGIQECSARSAGESSLISPWGGCLMDFSSCGRNLEYILKLQRGWTFKNPLAPAKTGLLSSYDGHLRNLN